MGQTNEIFAHVLTNDRFFYNEKWVNLIDLYVLYQNHLNMLVKDGIISKDEVGFLEQHVNEFQNIYTNYTDSYNRKLTSIHYILMKMEKDVKATPRLPNDQFEKKLLHEDHEQKRDIWMSFSNINQCSCYVVENNRICPRCKCLTDSIIIDYISKKKNKIPVSTHICSRCSSLVFSYNLYRSYRNALICKNPEVLSSLEYKRNKDIKRVEHNDFNRTWQVIDYVNSISKHKEINGRSNKTGQGSERNLYKEKPPITSIKRSSEPRIYTYCEFKLYSLSSKQEIAVFIQDTEKSQRKTDQWLLTNRSTIGIECLKAIANGIYSIKLENIDYNIQNLYVYDAKYIKRYKDDAYYLKSVNINNNNPHIVDFGNNYVDVYVYFKLTNSCLHLQHPIEPVTMCSLNSQTGKRYQVNAYYCSKCKKYFINHEAVKDMINRNMYPAFHYISADHYDGELKPMSQLMLYGYNARADGPSTVARHNILKWVIDSGLMSKIEIIKDLQFKIAYNGKRPGNEAARDKWEDDLDFLNTYVADNTKVINGRLRR